MFQYYPGRPFRLPEERAQLLSMFWPVSVAAQIMDKSTPEILKHARMAPDEFAWVRVVKGTANPPSWTLCMITVTRKRAEV